MTILNYISIEKSICPNCWDICFFAENAFNDGVIKQKPYVQIEHPFHILYENGKFICDDDNFSEFKSFDAAKKFAIAQTIWSLQK